MTALKQQYAGHFYTTQQRRGQLPSLSPERTLNPPQSLTFSKTVDVVSLESTLRERLSDLISEQEKGRSLLSRALARGELDQFLDAYFGNPNNVLFAEEKVPFTQVHTSSSYVQLTFVCPISQAPVTRSLCVSTDISAHTNACTRHRYVSPLSLLVWRKCMYLGWAAVIWYVFAT